MIIEWFDKLPYRAKEIIFSNIDFIDKQKLNDIMLMVQGIESPIEIILMIALTIVDKKHYYFIQHKEIINDKNYFIDFAIYNDGIINSSIKFDFKLAIECDGYEYHHKTKQQVDYDNQREYDLKMLGYQILRFSGTEIYKNPIEVANKILKFIEINGE